MVFKLVFANYFKTKMNNQELYLTAGLAGATFGMLAPVWRVCVNHVDKSSGETKYFQSVFNWAAVCSFFPYIWYDGVNYLCTPFFIIGNKISHNSKFAQGDLECRVTETRLSLFSSIFFGAMSIGSAYLYQFVNNRA